MTTLYLIRHGTTDANANGIFQGVLDLPLNDLGLKQARALGERFKDIDVDVLYCTPLQRTRQTAEGLRGDKDLPILVEPGIVEVDGGLMEAKKISVIDEAFPGLMETFKTDRPLAAKAPATFTTGLPAHSHALWLKTPARPSPVFPTVSLFRPFYGMQRACPLRRWNSRFCATLRCANLSLTRTITLRSRISMMTAT